jgi:hypothetical protein
MNSLLPLLALIVVLIVGSGVDGPDSAVGSIHRPELESASRVAHPDVPFLGDHTGAVLRKLGKPDLWGAIMFDELPADNQFSFWISASDHPVPSDLSEKFTWVYEDKSQPFDPWDQRATFITFVGGRVVRIVVGALAELNG